MATRRIDVIKPINEDKTAIQNNFGCSTKYRGHLITDAVLEFEK